MASTDLTSKIAPFLDRHLVFPLLEFLQDRQIYPEEEILTAKIELLGRTNMVDYAMDIHKSLHHSEEVPPAMVERRGEVVSRLKTLEEAAAPLVAFLQNPATVQELRSDKAYNLLMLQEKYQIGAEGVEALYWYAKFQFECGNYSGAADFLYQYRLLCSSPQRALSASWGKLAAELLMQNWDAAGEELARVKEMIDSQTFASPLAVLQERTWLLHWALFAMLHSENGRSNLVDLFLQDKYLSAIQTNAQHLLRYLVAAVLTCKRRRSAVKEVARVVEAERHAYSDPLTQFLLALVVDLDFDEAQSRLKECEELLSNDFFLGKRVAEGGYVAVPLRDEVIDSARLLMFENYCSIHRRIDIKVVAEKLSMATDAAERWMANLIRTAKLDATIDSEAGTLVMATAQPNVYENLIERSRGLTSRTYALASNVAAIALQQ
ncbi:unnamed protein product [Closterium sp. NIES-64]|nr:unnamed protein product [Closterium sp. Naga37s-1]CAI5945415.1 unnamed protein product [Closterium sp. NIES-65]CAI5984865.1 unnamed protein product [Closterium sp. NIES-64]